MAGTGQQHEQLAQQLQQDMRTRLGFAAKPSWVQQVVSLLQEEQPAFVQQPRAAQLQLLLEQLLMADLRKASAGGTLPPLAKVTGVLNQRMCV